jgi:hypothetical protein
MTPFGARYVGHRRGERNTTGRAQVFVREGAKEYTLPLRLDLFNHSPDGFNWGYGGSGPAQLALAILADAITHAFRETTMSNAQLEEMAVALHQKFKEEEIATIDPASDWAMSRDYVIEWVVKHK